MSLSKLTAKKLSPDQVQALVDRFVRDFSALDGLERMILFGSAASGEMTEASDIDLILIFDTRNHAERAQKQVSFLRSKPVWPADLLCVDREWFAEKSRIGGVMMVADREGRVVFHKREKT